MGKNVSTPVTDKFIGIFAEKNYFCCFMCFRCITLDKHIFGGKSLFLYPNICC